MLSSPSTASIRSREQTRENSCVEGGEPKTIKQPVWFLTSIPDAAGGPVQHVDPYVPWLGQLAPTRSDFGNELDRRCDELESDRNAGQVLLMDRHPVAQPSSHPVTTTSPNVATTATARKHISHRSVMLPSPDPLEQPSRIRKRHRP